MTPSGRTSTPALLAFDTATERMSIAVRGRSGEVLRHDGAAGAQASATLLPAILTLLARAGLALDALDAIAFGRGPGAFTGLRTACSVAQGLAFGTGRPVLPIDTLAALAEHARRGDPVPGRTWALLDARMDEVYAAQYRFDGGIEDGLDGAGWSVLDAPHLTTPERLSARWRDGEPPERVAGNALTVFGARLATGAARTHPEAWPDAAALLGLAGAAWRGGGGVDAALALPLYLRDKVAQTTAEREAARRAKADAGNPMPTAGAGDGGGVPSRQVVP